MKFLTGNFFRGILFLLPITLTIYISVKIFQKVDALGNSFLGNWVGSQWLQFGFGFLGTVIFITLIGYISSIWIGAQFFRAIEILFVKSPVIKGLYGMIRDTVHSLFGQQNFLSQAVLVDLPKLGYQRVGFITQNSPSFVEDNEEKVLVYLPHSFQISGEMVILPRAQVKPLDLPPDLVLKIIMSAGIVKS